MSAPQRFAALRVRDYRRYFVVALLSTMADNIEYVISYWVMFQAFHSRALGGFRLSAGSRNLSILLGPAVGAVSCCCWARRGAGSRTCSSTCR